MIQVSFDVTVDEGGTNSTSGTPFVYQASLTAIVTAISDNIGLVEGTILFYDQCDARTIVSGFNIKNKSIACLENNMNCGDSCLKNTIDLFF